MKILVIHSYYYPDVKGGAEYSLKKLCEGLVCRGHQVSVLCDNSEGNSNEIINGVSVFRRKMKCIRSSKNYFMKLVRALTELINPWNYKIINEIIKSEMPDVVYTNCLEHISPIAWFIAHKMNIKIVDTQRVYILLEPAGGKYRFGKCIWESVNRKLSEFVDVCAFISDYTKDVFIRNRFFSKAKINVIHNSIDFNNDNVNIAITNHLNNIADRPFKFVYLGNLSKHKGVDILLEAFSNLNTREAELHIAGDGYLRDKVINREKECIYFHGWLKEDDICKLLQNSHVVVCPSIWPEPFGRVVLDAYKQGMPVIAARSGGLCETVSEGESGLLVIPENVEDLTHAMNRMMNDKYLYSRCCKGTKNILQNFSLEKYLSNFELLFQNTIKK